MEAMPLKLTPEGRRLLKLAVKRILAMPSTFNMAKWYGHDSLVPRRKGLLPGYCGTVACLAGHIVLAAKDREPGSNTPTKARQLLFGAARYADGHHLATNDLFFANQWPAKFAARFERLVSNQAKAKVLAAVVKDYMARH